MKSIKICRVKMTYLDHFFSQKLSVPCFHEYYGEFFFNWSLETAKQFLKHLMTMQPTKFYITSSTEIEAVTSKKELFFTIMQSYNKLGNKKIDKFELASVIPFIVGKNFEEVLALSLKLAENELDDLLDNIFVDENKNKIDKMESNKLTIKIPENLLKILKNINEGFHESMTYYENKIKEQNKI